MPAQPTEFLHAITLNVLDVLYRAFAQAAAAQGLSVDAFLIEAGRVALGLGPSPRLAVDVLRERLTGELTLYVGPGADSMGVLTVSADRSVYAAVYYATPPRAPAADANFIARLVGDVIVIERDRSDKPLVDALVQAGVPRSQIILAYAGEPRPVAP